MMRVMLAQINPTIGDYKGNFAIIQNKISEARASKCDVILFPELATCGYPPRDLLYRQEFWDNHKSVIDKIYASLIADEKQLTVIVGGLHEVELTYGNNARYNAAWVLDRHYGKRVVHKQLLPSYDVFDELRYFRAETDPQQPIDIWVDNHMGHRPVACDVLICEDIWGSNSNNWLPASYSVDPVNNLKRNDGPLFVLNASPFWLGKIETTQKLVEKICHQIQRPVCWCNQVGAHDDIVTGGYSMISWPIADTVSTTFARAFEECSLIANIGEKIVIEDDGMPATQLYHPALSKGQSRPLVSGSRNIDSGDFEMWTIFQALRLHLVDYCRRTGFKTVVFGASGGIDSAVVGAIAAHALGGSNVSAITMPSPHSSEGSWKDAKALADANGMYFQKMDIGDLYADVQKMFLSGGKQAFTNLVADENIQPRLRAILLMTYSNEHGCLLLTTGNKSEIAVGYCTLYGDTCGGLAVISDVWKTQVYDLAKFINKYLGTMIPVNTIEKPPSAELRPDQQDTDSLPPYNVLDPILRQLVESEQSIERALWGKMSQPEVAKIARLYANSEYKRQQMPPGPKVQERSFGSGRRIPIAKELTRLS